ncbi:MAG: tyrosine-type recombinase/integrase [Pseudobdellovibrionaceae bacterium]
MLRFRQKPLPPEAEKFLIEFGAGKTKNTGNMYRAALHHFYRFLSQSKLDLAHLRIHNINEFDEDLARHNLKFVTRRANIQQVHKYLRWLEAKQVFPEGFSKSLFPNYRPEFVRGNQAKLPELAERFLEVMSVTRTASTVNGHKAGLRTFYKRQWKTGKPAYKIEREDIDQFLIDLKDNGVAHNQRASRIINLRLYLDWLYDHRALQIHPDDLIRKTDFPRKDKLLPKPFPVDVDLEIQRRLEQSMEIDHLGILLMRRCGLRVGEMRSLTVNCVGEDLSENWFLKVPIGKLHNERILPLDPVTVDLIHKIKNIRGNFPEPGTNTHYLISNPFGKRRSRTHFAAVLQDVTQDLAIPGKVNLHRLRHSFATSLLTAGMSLSSLKELLGHNDIRMTLNYAAVTQEKLRNEYFAALTKIQDQYNVTSYRVRTPDFVEGMNQSFYEAQRYIKKIVAVKGDPDPEKIKRLFGRLMKLRQEFSDYLKTAQP